MFAKLFVLFLLAGSSSVLANDLDQQIQFWEKKRAIDPEDFISPTKLGELYLKKARATGDLSANVEAEKNLRLALKKNPEHRAAVILLASACIAQHKFSEARAFAEKAVKMDPEDAFSTAVLGDACLELGDVARAESAYKKIVQLEPALATHSRMANLHWIKGDPAAAIHSYDAAIRAGEAEDTAPADLAWCHVQQGEFYFRTGGFKKAEERYTMALKLVPDYHFALDHVAELRAAQGKYDEAISLYKKLIERLPRPELQQALGDVCAFIQKTAEAKQWHDRALASYLKAAETGQVHYYHHLASFYADIQENPKEALKWARKDLELRTNVFAYDGLAWALYRNGEFGAARDAIKKALAVGTKEEQLLTHAGIIFVRAGDFDEGRKLLHQAAAINPRKDAFHLHR